MNMFRLGLMRKYCRRAALEKELSLLKQADQLSSEGQSTQRGNSGYSRYVC